MTEQAIAGGGGSADPEDRAPSITVAPPTEPGWYAYSGGRQTMIFLLREDYLTKKMQWHVMLLNGTMDTCEWGYIEQALGVWDLVPLVPARVLEDKLTVDMEFDSKDLETCVYEAIGAASVCWEPMDGTGVFQSERAKDIGDQLLKRIKNQSYQTPTSSGEGLRIGG